MAAYSAVSKAVRTICPRIGDVVHRAPLRIRDVIRSAAGLFAAVRRRWSSTPDRAPSRCDVGYGVSAGPEGRVHDASTQEQGVWSVPLQPLLHEAARSTTWIRIDDDGAAEQRMAIVVFRADGSVDPLAEEPLARPIAFAARSVSGY
jgi:hypothetical protein